MLHSLVQNLPVQAGIVNFSEPICLCKIICSFRVLLIFLLFFFPWKVEVSFWILLPTIVLVAHCSIFLPFSYLLDFYPFLLAILWIYTALLPLGITQQYSVQSPQMFFIFDFLLWILTRWLRSQTGDHNCGCWGYRTVFHHSGMSSHSAHFVSHLCYSPLNNSFKCNPGREGDIASSLTEQMSMLRQKGLETSGCGGNSINMRVFSSYRDIERPKERARIKQAGF